MDIKTFFSNPSYLFLTVALLFFVVGKLVPVLRPVAGMVCEIMCMVMLAGIIGVVADYYPSLAWVLMACVLLLRYCILW